ncbi:MAG TPA: site-specific DNA-methyltransferase [Pyrinomonadaceae bacterium]|nr:site-specific DNA-methyltransferase [Pyrinomonadaceae bacterium]
MHDEASRINIPTAEYQSVLQKEEQRLVRVTLPRTAAGLESEKATRNRDLDPQLVWRGKDEQDWSDLVVHAPPLYIQEKVHPKVLIDDLLKQSKEWDSQAPGFQTDLFADFNGIPQGVDKTEFYQHEQNWSNRMILGDSLQVMASLAEREGLRGKVQCVYIDPPYGIKFNSNFQWSTTSRDVKDGKVDHITREPEQVKAFRDTWRDGIHSYLTYLRDRLTVARDLLTDSGSIFVQIGDENVHRVRALMDEVFGDGNFIAQIASTKTAGQTDALLPSLFDTLLWYARDANAVKFRRLYRSKGVGFDEIGQYYLIQQPDGTRRRMTDAEISSGNVSSLGVPFRSSDISSNKPYSLGRIPFDFEGRSFTPPDGRFWTHSPEGRERFKKADRLIASGKSVRFVGFLKDDPISTISNQWTDTGVSGFAVEKVYVVQTSPKLIERCILMTTDPGDLVLDPTCGSGTTSFVAEQWGRRWITIDTSRVALALARARIMGARYPFYLLADLREGQLKEAEVTRTAPSSQPTQGNIRHGFVYERVPHITLKSIANNAEIDVIWDQWQAKLEPLRESLNATLKQTWQEWEIPREADAKWPDAARKLHAEWWQARIARQQEIDKSIAAKAEFEYLYDKPYTDPKKVRVAGPFTVESLSPHRVLGVDENDELIDNSGYSPDGDERDFVRMILENLKTAGVQQAHKEDKISFTSITPWPGYLVCAEGRYHEGDSDSGPEKRAAIFIGPEFGTVSRPDLVAAAREAGDADFDVLITCAFNYDAHSSEFNKLGRIPVLKARMNADLHMADDLKNTGKGNLFVIFGEPDIDILGTESGQIQVKINGVDVFHPNTGEVRSDGPDGIACWFLDTDYNEESFFVRQAYFLGANDPYKSLKTTLKAEINEEAWTTLHSDTSRPFDKPESGRIAVKVINHLGDEVMKVFRLR